MFGFKKKKIVVKDGYQLVPTPFNGHDGHQVYVGENGEIEFHNTRKGKIDYQTIDSVTERLQKSDIQNSPELKELVEDVIRFAEKREQEGTY